MLSKFFCYACVFFCIPALACVFFLSKAHQFTSKKHKLYKRLFLTPDFIRFSLSSISRQYDCPLSPSISPKSHLGHIVHWLGCYPSFSVMHVSFSAFPPWHVSFFCPKPTNSLQKNTSFTNVCSLPRISSGFLFLLFHGNPIARFIKKCTEKSEISQNSHNSHANFCIALFAFSALSSPIVQIVQKVQSRFFACQFCHFCQFH